MLRMVVCLISAACLLAAETPRVGVIEIFGLRKVKPEAVRKALGISEGDPLPASKSDTEERIEGIEGVALASLTAVCCDGGKAVLYVGIEERGAPHFDFHSPPGLDLKVPDEISQTWLDFINGLELAAKRGNVQEDLTRGHSLLSDPDARECQEKFLTYAEKYFDLLREVLRGAADAQQRAIAAYVLGYSPKKKVVANDLQYAIQDFDPTVRNNAMRALGAIAVYADLHPDSEIRVSPTWFVEMLNSVQFTDRNKASVALVNFTEKRDAATLGLLRERALPSLIEMAQWRNLGHALPAFILLGRAGGVPEETIQRMWKEGKRRELVRMAAATAPGKK